MRAVHVVSTAVLVSCFLVVGCGSDDSGVGREHRYVETNRVAPYESITELAAESDLIAAVAVPPDGANIGTDSSSDSTVTTVAVLERYEGEGPDSIPVRQPGSASLTVLGTAELIVPGQTYLLFLEVFEFEGGESVMEWSPVGGIGVYRLDDGMYVRSSTDAVDLPEVLSVQDPLGRS